MALAPNSLATASTAERRFQKFLDAQGLVLGPEGISDRDLRRYIAMLASCGTIKRYDTIKTYLSMGVRRYHEIRNMKFVPIKDRPTVRAVKQGAKRHFKDSPSNQKLPLTLELLIRIRGRLHLGDPLDLCVLLALELGFFCLLRKANLACKSGGDAPAKAKARKHAGVISRRSIQGDNQGNTWIVLENTKTIQFGERILRLPVPSIPGHPLCPIATLRTYLEVTGDRPLEEPLLGYYVNSTTAKGAGQGAAGGPRGGGRVKWVPLTHGVLVRRLKEVLTEIGENPERYAGHSLRRGGATFAFNEANLHCITIKARGDWASAEFLRYCEVQEKLRLEGAKAMAEAAQEVLRRMRQAPPTPRR